MDHAGAALLTPAALVWLVPLVLRMGGLTSIYSAFADYLWANSREFTAAFGASATASLGTFKRAKVWNFGLTVARIWAVPLAWCALRVAWSRVHTVALLSSFVPPFLFHAFVHVRDVDQTLISIPVLCVVGGAVLARVRPRPVLVAAVVAALLVSWWNFRWPMFRDMGAASRGAMRYVTDWTRSTFAALNDVRGDRDAVFVWDDAVVTWRQVSYYYPEHRLLDLRLDEPRWILSQRFTPALRRNREIIVPDTRTLVLGVSFEQAKRLEALPGTQRRGPLIVLPWQKGATVRVGSYILTW